MQTEAVAFLEDVLDGLHAQPMLMVMVLWALPMFCPVLADWGCGTCPDSDVDNGLRGLLGRPWSHCQLGRLLITGKI